jgi:hypothetical protein
LSKRNVKLILKVLSDLEPLRGSSNKKTLYSTRSCVNWAFFSTRVPLPPGEVVQVTPPRFNSRRYIEILEEVLLPSVRTIYPEEEMEQIVLVQDNCSIHTARIVQDWFEDHPELVVLIWPSKSPDLNPIENLWGQMVFNWNNPPERVQFRTVAELDENVTRVWENMRGRDYCQNMVDGMRQRLQECIDNRGYYTHY